MSTLKIKTSVENNKWVLEFEVTAAGATIPRDIFMYENTGTGLGEYYGVCTLADYRRFQTHQVGVDIPVFGNKFLKHVEGKMTFNIDVNVDNIKSKILLDVKSFKVAYETGEVTENNYTI